MFNSLEELENRLDELNRSNTIRWTVRWTYQDKQYCEGYEFHMLAVKKQLDLQEIGIESIIECAR